VTESRRRKMPKYVTIVQLHEATDGSQCYVAYHPELPTCVSQGDTPEEAEANLVEATQLALEHLASSGLEIPPPMRWGSVSVRLRAMAVDVCEADGRKAQPAIYDSSMAAVNAPTIEIREVPAFY